MIENIIFLLVANTLAPYIFFPPALLAPLPLVQKFIEPPTVLQNMNLPRIYQPQEFRKAFKQSLRTHHPDHGGQQQVFQQIQGLKKIMNQQTNYYDLYNVTDADVSSTGMKLSDVIQLKKNSFYTETGIFYFIAFLYILSFTIDAEAQKSRKIMLAVTALFVIYEFYIHQYPKSPTVIDLIYDKIPLFIQRKYLRRAMTIWLALIRAYFSRKVTEEQTLIKILNQEKPQSQYKDVLQRLLVINTQKLNQKIRYQQSLAFKIRNWISKGISAFFMLILIKNLIPGLNFF